MSEETKRMIKIVGLGVSIPEKVLTNADLEKMVETSDEWIVTRTGIRERRIGRDDQATSDLGIDAARAALADAKLEPKDVDLILVATNTADTAFPSTACWIQKGLGAADIPAFDISAGCTAFIYGLIIAQGLILSGTNKRILLVAADMLSRITNWEDRSTCVLFGDGAGAVILEESRDASGILSHHWSADGNLGELIILPGGGSRLPASHATVDEKKHTLHMKGNDTFKHAVKRMGEAATTALARAGVDKEGIDWFIPHQANMRIIEATRDRLKVPKEKVAVNIHKYGNCSVATIPLALEELVREGKVKRGDIIVLDAFGAGLTWGAIVYRW